MERGQRDEHSSSRVCGRVDVCTADECLGKAEYTEGVRKRRRECLFSKLASALKVHSNMRGPHPFKIVQADALPTKTRKSTRLSSRYTSSAALRGTSGSAPASGRWCLRTTGRPALGWSSGEGPRQHGLVGTTTGWQQGAGVSATGSVVDRRELPARARSVYLLTVPVGSHVASCVSAGIHGARAAILVASPHGHCVWAECSDCSDCSDGTKDMDR